MTIKEWCIRIKNKIIYKYGVHFPYSKVRVRSLRALGWKVGKNVYFPEDIKITVQFIYDRGKFEMGDNVSIGPGCIILTSSSPNWSVVKHYLDLSHSETVIGESAWIGAGAIIMPGVKIGKCSVVGAGAVVTKDVPEYCVVAGVPAKVIRRFDVQEKGEGVKNKRIWE